MFERTREFLRRWQDVLFWLPLVVVATYLVYRIIPAIDPRSGIDGWGDLFAGMVAGIKGVMATIAAWLCKNLYQVEPRNADEQAWLTTLTGADATPLQRRYTLLYLTIDRAGFMLWLVFWGWVLF